MSKEKTHLDYLEETRRELHKDIEHFKPEDVKKLISLESALGLFGDGSFLSTRDLNTLSDMFMPASQDVDLSIINRFKKNAHIGILCSTNNSGNLEIAAVDFTDLVMSPKSEHHYYQKHNIGYVKDFRGYLNYASVDNLSSSNPKEHLNFLIGKILPSLVETYVSNFQKQAEKAGHSVWRWERYTVEKYSDSW